VIIIGDEELKSAVEVLPDMATKEQRTIKEDELL
jgi:histidyl-tRNA synthetase